MKYGHFSKDGREYVITNPNTPGPGSTTSSTTSTTASFPRAAAFFLLAGPEVLPAPPLGPPEQRPLGPLPLHQGRIGQGKPKVWTPNWQPSREKLDSWEARHGFGYTNITATNNGVKGRSPISSRSRPPSRCGSSR